MKKSILILIAFGLSGALFSHLASAHGGRIDRFNFGIQLGYPGYYGFGYYDPFFYPPYYSYPPVIVPMTQPVIVPSTPPVYIQQQQDSTASQQHTQYWYYCQDTDGYYPYVKQCPGGWLRVNPQPPAQ
ncbi:MAG: hypothetical protein H6937_10210 [Burkholderiales bacterium]|nr:hypothetical protein [Burkholderiales bacterium]MDR4516013.1 hypothetical protein [Nitrosomonas sp.]